MKALKKILCALTAFSVVLSMSSLSFAEDGTAGVENNLLQENFETAVTFEDGQTEYTVPKSTSAYNGWSLQNTSGSSYNDNVTHKIIKENGNQFMSRAVSAWNSNSGIVAMKKSVASCTEKSKLYHLSFKFKRGTQNPGNLQICFGGAQWTWRFDNGRLYAGVYGNSAGDSVYSFAANKWYNVEIFADYQNKKYSYAVNGEIIKTANSSMGITESTALRNINSTPTLSEPTDFTIQSVRNSLSGVANAELYIDDITLAEIDEQRLLEITAEKMNIPSAAKSDITLPREGFGGTSVSWATSNASLITAQGAVTRPESGAVTPVTLTATITKGGIGKSFPYTVNVLPQTVYFCEDFESASLGKIAGYNGWTESETVNSAYAHSMAGDIVTSGSGNKAGRIIREVVQTSPGFYSVQRTFDESIEAGIVSLKMNLFYNKYPAPVITLADSSASYSLNLRTAYNSFYLNDKTGATLGGGSVNATLTGPTDAVWHALEVRIDLSAKTLEVIYDGISAKKYTDINLSSLDNITLNETRTGVPSQAADTYFLFDNIVAEVIDVPYAYTVTGFTFKGSDGEDALYPENGGSVSKASIKKHKSTEDSVMIVALYNGANLLSASAPIDITSAPINGEKEFSVNLPIESANSTVRAFVLDKESIAPVGLDSIYAKRVPLKVFVAGDSMAENVPNSTSSKVVDGVLQEYAREGWGMRIGAEFSEGSVTVANYSVGGRTAQSFVEEGRLQAILANGQRGDFVLVSFGHNDQGKSISTAAYKENLKEISASIKEKGMTPIFITPITRISMTASDTDSFTTDAGLAAYAEAMKEAAEESGVACLDLNGAFNSFFENMTYAQIRAYYVPKEIDGTHLSPSGATKAAELIAGLLEESDSTLKDILQ